MKENTRGLYPHEQMVLLIKKASPYVLSVFVAVAFAYIVAVVGTLFIHGSSDANSVLELQQPVTYTTGCGLFPLNLVVLGILITVALLLLLRGDTKNDIDNR